MSVQDDRNRVARLTSFLASVIKSGEGWSTQCDEEFERGSRALNRLAETGWKYEELSK